MSKGIATITYIMVTALIFAGGTGKRMNNNAKPKQFLELHGKPIIIHTIENFEKHPSVDNILVVCLEGWIQELQSEINRYGITKVTQVVKGGKTGHDSIFLGLKALQKYVGKDEIVLIHDGVRPLITDNLITENIDSVKKFGTAITAEIAKESIILSDNGIDVDCVPLRTKMYVSKAPQSFRLGWILEYYERAQSENFKSIDSSHLLSHYGAKMHIVKSTNNNIKITEPADFYVVRALYETIYNEQIFGI